jgi:hypothetical protein
MFIPDSNFPILDLGSRVKRIPDLADPHLESGSASKNLSIFNPKNRFYALENMIRDVHPGSRSRIRILIFAHPDSRDKKGTGSGSATLLGRKIHVFVCIQRIKFEFVSCFSALTSFVPANL